MIEVPRAGDFTAPDLVRGLFQRDTNTKQEMMTRVPRGSLLVLVAVPAAVFCLLALLALGLIGVLAFTAAGLHASLSHGAARALLAAGGLVACGGAAIAVPFVERRVLGGRRREQTADQRRLTRLTRAMSLAIVFLLSTAAPAALREVEFQAEVATARNSGSEQARYRAIGALSHRGTSRAYRALKSIATNGVDAPLLRGQATVDLRRYPQSKHTLIELTTDPQPEVRRAAGTALLVFAHEEDAWAAVERLALSDDNLHVQEQVTVSIVYLKTDPSVADRRLALLREIARGKTPAAHTAALALERERRTPRQ